MNSTIYESSGDVGIGTSSPSSTLHVVKAQDAVTAIGVQNTNAGASAQSSIATVSN